MLWSKYGFGEVIPKPELPAPVQVGAGEVALQDPPAQPRRMVSSNPPHLRVCQAFHDHKTLADQSCGVPVSLGAPVQI